MYNQTDYLIDDYLTKGLRLHLSLKKQGKAELAGRVLALTSAHALVMIALNKFVKEQEAPQELKDAYEAERWADNQ